MQTAIPTIENKTMRLQVKRMSIISSFFTLIIIFICYGLPIMGFILQVASEEGLRFGLVIFTILMWGFGVYMTRAYLWNTRGAELYQASKEGLTITNDFKYFKDKIIELPTDGMQFTSYPCDDDDDLLILRFQNGENCYDSTFLVEKSNMSLVVDYVETTLNLQEVEDKPV